MEDKAKQLARRTSLIYGLVACVWILTSDQIVRKLFPNAEQVSNFQTYKGLAFVGMTTWLLYYAMRLAFQQRENERAKRENKEQFFAGQNQVLEMIASGVLLPQTLEKLLLLTEKEIPGMLSSILLLEDNQKLRHVASPNIPTEFSTAVDGVVIGPKVGSCGTAAFLKQPVIVTDIATDPLWEKHKELVLKHGLQACWSYPIFDSKQNVLGTFALYFRTPMTPEEGHRKLIESVTHVAAIAIAKNREEKSHYTNEERYRILTDHAADTFFVHDQSGMFVEVNRRACEQLGYAREELLQMRVTDVEKDFDQQALEGMLRQVRPGQVRTVIGRHARKDGTHFPVETRIGVFEADGRVLYHGLSRDITDRKRAADALEMFRTLVDRVNDSIEVIDPETGRFLDINEKACTDLGYTREEMLSLSVMDVDATQDVAGFKSRKEKLWDTGALMHESTYRRKDGVTFPVEVNMKWVWLDRDYIVAVVRDITERKIAETELRKREDRFRLLIENASDIVTVINADGIIRFQSPSVTRILGYQPEEMVNRSAFDFLHQDDVTRVTSTVKSAFANPGLPVSVEYRYHHSDGTWRYLQSVGRSIAGESPDGFLILNSRDISETRKLEEQFRQSQKMEAIGQLAGGVAHDLNNILTVVHMQLDLLKHGDSLTEIQSESVLDIEKASRRAADLTRQLLMFSRRQAAMKHDLDLNAVVTNITKMLQRIMGEDVAMHISYAPQPLPVHADSGMLDQILLNLAVNSRDAMPVGGKIVIETSVAEFDEFAAAQKNHARIGRFACLSVSDNGKGIPPEVLPRIFEPFFTTKDIGKGTGLGLATVFGIVQQHNGWINAYSEPGKGTTFRMYLPLQKEAEEVVTENTTVARGGNETILLVEDEQSLRVLVRNVLTRLGYRVLEATTGLTAVEVWKEHRNEIKLLLTDLVMPDGMTGKQLAEVLVRENSELKVIYTSGYSRDIAGQGFVLQDGVNFLSKPFQAAKLAQTVRNSLDG